MSVLYGADHPSALMQLADEATAAGDFDAAAGHLAEAVHRLTADGENRQAAMTCVRLGQMLAHAVGNKVAARPWYARAMRLLENEPPCLEQGYAAVASLGCDVDDPVVLADRAELALDRARRFQDVDLEVKALADGGLGHVQAGRVAEGMAMLDEALALACTRVTNDPVMIGRAVCSFFTACHVAADLERVEAWSGPLREKGIIGQAPGPQAFGTSHCESVRGALLCDIGRWGEAEDILLRAFADMETVMPGRAWNAPIALADLRIRQGRLTEAEALLLGKDHDLHALLSMARLHLARGDFDLARATVRRGLRLIGEDKVRGAALLAVLVEAELGRGEVERAAEASAELDERTRGVGLPSLAAEAARHRARVQAARGRTAETVESLHEALAQVAALDLPLLRMSLHLDLARMHEAAGDRAEAVIEARAANALLARLDVVLAADDAALLARLVEERTEPVSPACRVATLVPDGGWWTAGCGDTSVRLRDTKGMRYLAELVAHPGAERHALDLVDVVEGVPDPQTGIDRRRLGDAGAVLDAEGRALYRRRVTELRDEVDEALDVGDDDRAARAQGELDALVAELARAFGLGGRERKASAAAEKARLNVTRALRKATSKLAEALPGPGDVLDRRVRTGLFCAYEPHAEDTILWSVHPPMNGTGSK